ncbi:glycine betaine ABC transporter substrate-binding protein [Georgenia sp. Z1491]|uniref:glycine betaine ABC transporter substrate-binding protein n=1 Tax=Georgenia sp. Z1491 TaxID=3416707 RepID=UPI003CE90FF6
MRTTRTWLTAGAVTTAAAPALAACGGGDDPDEGAGSDGGDGSGETITIGVFHGWEEGIAASYIWKHILEEQGYAVETEHADVGVVFTGLAAGDYDLNFNVALPHNHEDYLEQYGDDIEDLGVWFEDYPNTMVVNDDAPITSLTELADHADEFDNRIVGIEPGAGLTRYVQDSVIPTYGLEDMEFVVSSTPSMLADLQGAIESGENVVATLWRPHWAYDAFPIRDLEDPEGALGPPNDIHTFSSPGFAEEHPEVAEWSGRFAMDDEQVSSLETIMFNELNGEENDEAVDRWVEENPDFVPEIVGE